MNVIFAGTPVFAERHLQAIIESHHQISAVYTQPDRPAGRGKKLQASPVKILAEHHALPVEQPLSLKDPEAQRHLATYKADVMVVVAYGLLLPKAVLDSPLHGCINVHGSILPRWRGAAPIQRAIQAGDQASGVTIMQMDEGLDTGPMLLKAHCAIQPTDTSATLHDTLANIGPNALLDVLDQIAQNRLSPTPQDDGQSCYARKIEKHEAELDWTKSAVELDRTIRAFQPFPVCFSQLNGERVKIHRATTAEVTGLAPGQLRIESQQIYVGCGNGALCIKDIQFPGKKRVSSTDFLNGSGGKLPAGYFQ